MIKILLVDDYELARASIKLLLNDAENIDVIGEAKNGEDAICAAHELKPDIVLMGLNMPGRGGFETVARLLCNKPLPKVLVVSAYIGGFIPMRLLGLSVDGYLSKHPKREDMLVAIQTVYAGNRYTHPLMADAISSYHIGLRDNPSPLTQLTERELQILIMVASGMGIGDVAKNLYLSKKTINGYMFRILKKLGAKTNTEAAHMAIKSGLIDMDT